MAKPSGFAIFGSIILVVFLPLYPGVTFPGGPPAPLWYVSETWCFTATDRLSQGADRETRPRGPQSATPKGQAEVHLQGIMALLENGFCASDRHEEQSVVRGTCFASNTAAGRDRSAKRSLV